MDTSIFGRHEKSMPVKELTSLDLDYVKRFASATAADEAGEEEESEDDMSSVGSYASGDEDEEVAGNMDEL